MTTNDLLKRAEYEFAITPLKSGGRADVHVITNGSVEPAAFTQTDIVGQMRSFVAKLEAEAEARKDDPVAMVNALARMEALLADVRYATSTIRDHTAHALADTKIRRLTIDNVATVEGTSESPRTDWQDQELLADMIYAEYGATNRYVHTETGVFMDDPEVIAEAILEWIRPAWRLTPIRDAGLDPDDYSTQAKDEDGTPLRTPTVSMKDNALR